MEDCQFSLISLGLCTHAMCIQFYFNINKVLDVSIQKCPVGAEAESESLEAKMTACPAWPWLSPYYVCVTFAP